MKKLKPWHTSTKKMGMGEFQGTAIRQKFGKLREPEDIKSKMQKLKKPISLA